VRILHEFQSTPELGIEINGRHITSII